MESIPFLSQLFLILLVSTLVALAFERARLPSLLGFLLAGIALGPSGFSLISDLDQIHHVAELGVALLLLTIGLEFSFERLKGLRNLAVIGGGLQIGLSTIVAFVFCWWQGRPPVHALILGTVIALSSTAIVLKYLVDRGELDTHHGRIAVAILLFQDIAVVPLMILINALGGHVGNVGLTLGVIALKLVLLIVLVVFFSKFVLNRLMRRITMTRNREMFFLASAVICLGTAWTAGELGLSFAIGAFFAGLMFANTQYGTQLMGDIIPFRHIFVSLFFVSIGLLFDVSFAFSNLIYIAGVVLAVLVVNFILITGLVLGFGYPPRVALTSGLLLSQIGEFSFIILETAFGADLITPFLYQLLLSSAFITMFLTPFLFMLVPFIGRMTSEPKVFGLAPGQWKEGDDKIESLADHVILCGFGAMGRDLASTMIQESIPFVVLDMDPTKTKAAKRASCNVIYGDAANVEVMIRAGVQRAKAVVVSFSDPIGRTQIIRVVERLNPAVHLSVRTRSEKEVAKLFELGVDQVVVEEWEANYEIHRDLLSVFRVDAEKIDKHLKRLRYSKEYIVETAILDTIKNSKD